jgi:hypothetical protein
VELQFITGLILSAGIGLSLGLIGGGGSIITVPVLVYVMSVDAHLAIPMSLAVVGATSFIGSFLHRRRGNVQLKTGLLFGAAGIFGALAGSPLTRLFSSAALLLIFAGLMLFVAVLMFDKGSERRKGARGRLCGRRFNRISGRRRRFFDCSGACNVRRTFDEGCGRHIAFSDFSKLRCGACRTRDSESFRLVSDKLGNNFSSRGSDCRNAFVSSSSGAPIAEGLFDFCFFCRCFLDR